MSTIDIFRRARELLSSGWCKYSLALDAHDRSVPAWHPLACRWCATGAIDRAICESVKPFVFKRVLNEFKVINGINNVSHWNDYMMQTKDDVLKTFDQTIERLCNDDN